MGKASRVCEESNREGPQDLWNGGEGQQRRTPSSVGIVTGKDSRVCGEGNKDLRIYGVYREGDRKGPQDLWGR